MPIEVGDESVDFKAAMFDRSITGEHKFRLASRSSIVARHSTRVPPARTATGAVVRPGWSGGVGFTVKLLHEEEHEEEARSLD